MARRITTTFRIVDTDTQREIAGSKTDRIHETTADNHIQQRLALTTSESTFTLPASIGNAGQVVVENLDDTNSIEVGTATTVRPFRVGPLRRAVFEIPAATSALYFAAVAGTPSIEVTVMEA